MQCRFGEVSHLYLTFQVQNSEIVSIVSELLGLNEEELSKRLVERVLRGSQRRGSYYVLHLTPDTAVESRDALAKSLYANLFDWVVKKINHVIQCTDKSQMVKYISLLVSHFYVPVSPLGRLWI